MVWGHLMRLVSERAAIREKTLIEDARGMDDRNEYDYPGRSWGPSSHALNLFDVQVESFYENIVRYACARDYEYAVIQEGSDFQPPWRRAHMERLIQGAERLQSFGTSDDQYSVTATQFDGWPWVMLGIHEFGPKISIYRLNKDVLCADPESRAHPILHDQQLLERGMARAHHFTIAERRNVHMDISTDQPVTALLFSEDQFSAWQEGRTSKPIFRMELPREIIPLEGGQYVLVVGADDGPALYSLTLGTDELFFRE